MKTEIYNSLQKAKEAKTRNRINHKLDEPKNTNLIQDGKYEVIWAEPTDPEHSKNKIEPPKRRLTTAQLLQEFANERGIDLI